MNSEKSEHTPLDLIPRPSELSEFPFKIFIAGIDINSAAQIENQIQTKFKPQRSAPAIREIDSNNFIKSLKQKAINNLFNKFISTGLKQSSSILDILGKIQKISPNILFKIKIQKNARLHQKFIN